MPQGGADDSRIEALWLSSVLPLVVQSRGREVLHASAVAGPSGVVVLCGPSGAGKSTLAGALAMRGHELVADDALPFQVSDGAAVALPLRFSLRLRPRSAELLETASRGTPVAPAQPSLISTVVVLEPDPAREDPPLLEQFSTDRSSPGEPVRTLLPQLYCFSLPESKERLVRELAALVNAVRVFRFAYAQRPDELGAACDVLEELLAVDQ
jgi:hypothetical protein